MKKLLFLLMLYSTKIFACQGHLDDYNSHKKKAREISEANAVATGVSSFFCPIVALVVSAVGAGSSAIFDHHAEKSLKKYEHCLREKHEEEDRAQTERARVNAESKRKKARESFDEN